MSLKALVVDDEPPARRRLLRMLATMDDVEVVGEAGDGEEALKLIEGKRPDVVFADIKMPGMDGLALAKNASGNPAIIFTTAFGEYAVDAFETEALDYLLKPISKSRLEKAVQRARTRRERNGADSEQLVSLINTVITKRQTEPMPRVLARDKDTTHVFDAREISRFFAESKYSAFLYEECEYLFEESLSSLEQRLAQWGFMRVHRAELVNLNHVRALNQGETGTSVLLVSGETARVSRRATQELKKRLSALPTAMDGN